MNIPPKYEDVVAQLEISQRHLDRMIEAHDALQQRLTVAENDLTRKSMRASMLDGLLREIVESLPAGHLQHELRLKLLAALKPAEEGGEGRERIPYRISSDRLQTIGRHAAKPKVGQEVLYREVG